MSRGSIRMRLTLWYTAVLAATLTLVAAGVWFAIRDSINDTVDKELRARLKATREVLRTEAADELAESAAVTPAGTRFRMASADGKWIYQSTGTEAWGEAPPLSGLPQRGRAFTATQSGRPVRVLTAPAGTGLVQIGIPLDEFDEMLTAFTWTALFGAPVLLGVAAVSGYWMSRRALAPVEAIALTASEIQARDLSARLPLRGVGDELDTLSETLNAMLGRLEEAFHRITQFTADASHELRTPLAIIRTTAEVMRRRPRNADEYTAALDRIAAESARTTALIEDLLLLARADAPIDSAPFGSVSLEQVVSEACRDFRAVIEMAGLTLHCGIAAEAAVAGDEHALRRLLLILLDNAVKYSRPGGGIEVTLQAPATIAVRDNGIGISTEDLPHIFERFYRASKDRSRIVAGIGLGLSIAQTIAYQHGGQIVVESRLGQGSTFRVILPDRRLRVPSETSCTVNSQEVS